MQFGAAGQNEAVRHGQRVLWRWLRDIAVRALCALSSVPACALDTGGYLRLGSGKVDDPKRTCYDLAISGGHYRLGNECDFYGEFGLAHAVSAQGATYRAMAMVNLQHPGMGDAVWSTRLEQIYVESVGLGGASDLKLWLGKRYHGRFGVHILDTWFVRMDGAGLGIEEIAVAGAKLGVAYFRTEAMIRNTDPCSSLSPAKSTLTRSLSSGRSACAQAKLIADSVPVIRNAALVIGVVSLRMFAERW